MEAYAVYMQTFAKVRSGTQLGSADFHQEEGLRKYFDEDSHIAAALGAAHGKTSMPVPATKAQVLAQIKELKGV